MKKELVSTQSGSREPRNPESAIGSGSRVAGKLNQLFSRYIQLWSTPIIVIAALLCAIAAASSVLPEIMRSAVIEAAYHSNIEAAEQLKITRGYYTQNIVSKLGKTGPFSASHQHKDNPLAIPLPATFVKDISELLKERATTLSLVSPFPWPHRADRKLDDFEQAAWDAFQADPGAVFSQPGLVNGQRTLRVAVSDRMTSAACVSCHNTDPLSVKRDWKIGDVRGVMEVTKMIEPQLAEAERRASTILSISSAAAVAAALALVICTFVIDRRTQEKKRALRRIRYLAYHDALTGLGNRVLFSEQLERCLETVEPGKQAAVICIDLDHFKEVNDANGHAAGDALLSSVAKRLRQCTKSSDSVARLGGDEFVILQTNINHDNETQLLVRRLHGALTAPFIIFGKRICISASIGIAVTPNDGVHAEVILKHADLASYQAKSEGGGRWCFFEPSMNDKRERRKQLEIDLANAIENQQLELFYQPIYNLKSNKISGFEALLRWHHPEFGFVPPDVFIPIAEEVGLIEGIGSWVLHTACIEAARWPEHLILSVNLSPAQFKNPQLVSVILLAVAASRLKPQRLELEITETALIHDKAIASTILGQLRTFGIRLALDDFGTGFSSLSYLQNYAFDTVKIDKSFIAGVVHKDGRGYSIIRATVALAQSLGMETTAEGIETKEQLERVRSLGCSCGQGYYFHKPLPAHLIAALHSPITIAADKVA